MEFSQHHVKVEKIKYIHVLFPFCLKTRRIKYPRGNRPKMLKIVAQLFLHGLYFPTLFTVEPVLIIQTKVKILF